MGHVGIFGASLASDLDAWDATATKGVATGDLQGGGAAGGFGGAPQETAQLAQADNLASADAGGAPSASAVNGVPASGYLARGAPTDKQNAKRPSATGSPDDGGGAAAGVEPTVRSNFADSAFWIHR